jgi:hypothetical protein
MSEGFGDHNHILAAKSASASCLFVGNKGTTLTKILHLFQSPPLLFTGVTHMKG